jgi:hypothetical protein
MIEVYQRVDPDSYGNRGGYWIAECKLVDGRMFSARLRLGASNELARKLVAAGVPDDTMQTYESGMKGIYYPSFYEAAKWAYREDAHTPLKRIRWTPRPEGLSFGPGKGKSGGVTPEDDEDPLDENRVENTLPRT